MLKKPLLPRLLKKAQVQGGARGEARGVLGPYVAAPRERANAADGPFSAATHDRRNPLLPRLLKKVQMQGGARCAD
jgi:hypothetical protein